MAERELQPTLASLVNRARELAADGIRVAVPARVTRWDGAARAVDCQPLLRRPGPTGTMQEDPGLVGVPVLWPGSAAFRVRFPLRDGDLVWLMVADRNADHVLEAMSSGTAAGLKPEDAAEGRQHDLSDCVALPVAAWTGAQMAAAAAEPDRLVLEAGNARVALAEAGTVALGNAASAVELLSLLDQVIAALQASAVDVLGTPSLGTAAQATLAALKVQLASIRGVLP